MVTWVLLLASVKSVMSTWGEEKEKDLCGYKSCTDYDPNMLNVHIVPHSHNDVAWLKTFDQYYFGERNDIQNVGVQYILDSVIKELWNDRYRRFTFSEIAFFDKWWTQQNEIVKAKTFELVRQGQLQFAGGAWSINDEATTHYQSIIDQFTLGLGRLKKIFGECGRPRVAWQLGVFGHSREFASLLASMCFDGLFLDTVDFQDKEHRLKTKEMEMIWRGDDSLGGASDIFTSILYDGYNYPEGFCFDVQCSEDPIVDDPNATIFNLTTFNNRLKSFVKIARERAKFYRTNNVLIPMGGNYMYQNAGMWFRNLDRLIEYINDWSVNKGKKKLKLFYSTPACYLKAVNSANVLLPIKQDDFLPYASDKNSYFTGFYTSRPTLKFFEREANRFLQMFKQLQVFANLSRSYIRRLDELQSAMGLLQSHNSITGTQRQHVLKDTQMMLSAAIEKCLIIARTAISKRMGLKFNLKFHRCRLNESSCPTSEQSDQFIIAVYNPLGWNVTEAIRIPVKSGFYEVFRPNGYRKSGRIKHQMVEIPMAVQNIPSRNSEATHELVFLAKLTPVSYKTFYVRRSGGSEWTQDENSDKERRKRRRRKRSDNDLTPDYDTWKETVSRKEKKGFTKPLYQDFYFTNQHWKMKIDENGELLHSILKNGTEFELYPEIFYYTDSDPPKSSGAYIFRSKSLEKIYLSLNSSIEGNVVKEIRFTSDDNVLHTLRLYTGLHYLENEWLVGPINVKDKIGKQFVIKYVTDLQNNGIFYTDSNSRQMIKRKVKEMTDRVKFDDVPSNYYPVTSKIYINSKTHRFTILTDRSEGAASFKDGQMEIMLHRRLLKDDGQGLNESLNEIYENQGIVVRGKHRLYLSGVNNLRQYLVERKQHFLFHMQPIVLVSETFMGLEEWTNLPFRSFSWVNRIEEGLHLLTVEPLGVNQMRVRIENFLEDTDYTDTNIQQDVEHLFRTFTNITCELPSLAENIKFNDRAKDELHWDKDIKFSKHFHSENPDKSYLGKSMNKINDTSTPNMYIFRAKEIKTFIINYEHKDFKRHKENKTADVEYSSTAGYNE